MPQTAAQRRLTRNRRKRRGLCVDCGKPREVPFARCRPCLDKVNAAVKRSPSYRKGRDHDPGNTSMMRRRVLYRANARAAEKGLEATLRHSDIHWPDDCPCCGTAMSFKGKRGTTPSLDRLDSAKGYTPENARIICSDCNRRKNDSTADQLRQIADWMDRELGD